MSVAAPLAPIGQDGTRSSGSNNNNNSNRRRHLRRSSDGHTQWVDEDDEEDDDDESDDNDHQAAFHHYRHHRHHHQQQQQDLWDFLRDDVHLLITNEIQWREAFLYNVGARILPEGEEATDDFDRAWGGLGV